jgi:hypothetical protein
VQKFSLQLESQEQARELLDLLWDSWGVKGEIELVPMEGQCKLHVIAEKDLTAQQLEKLPGKRS